MIPFLKYQKIYFLFSGILVIGSIVVLIVYGLNLGIDFVGGSEIYFEAQNQREDLKPVIEEIQKLNVGAVSIRNVEDKGVILRTKELDEETRAKIFEILKNSPAVNKESISYEKIGAIIGSETKRKALIAIVLSLIGIILYVAFAFRKLSKPITSWEYGIATVIALFHDVLIPLGVFAFLSHLSSKEFTIPVLTALLTIFGYSVNDTVVVFDRIRENYFKERKSSFEEIANKSLNQTLTRSINTSLTTLFVLIALYLIGGEPLKDFSLTLIIGIIAGTYSSMFLAVPLINLRYRYKTKK